MAENEKVTVAGQEPLVTGVEQEEEDIEVREGGDLKVALQKEREKRKEATKREAALKAEVEKFKPLAEEYSQLLPYLPHILKAAQKPAEEETKVEQDKEALEYAEVMGLETEDGKPDVAKARKALDFHDRRTGRTVNEKIAPANRGAAVAQVEQIRQRAYNAKDSDGKLYAKREFIDKVFSQIAPEALVNPDNAVAALVMARGLGGPGDEVQEPLHIEAGGRAPGRKKEPLSDMGKSIARIRGKSEKDWSALDDNPAETGWDLE